MHPPRFSQPNHVPQGHWRPHGPTFGHNWPMQLNNKPYSREHNFSNNNDDHWCETCDRGFRTLEILSKHKQQHQKCNIDGCQFIAHPKVITKHIQMQHSTGLYKKIAKLDKPEEIQKWREERKKRYPTKENIEKRIAEIKEKIDRGEKMGMRNHRENRPNGRGMKRKWGHDSNRRNFKKKYQANKSSSEVNNKSLVDDNKKSSIIQKGKLNTQVPKDDPKTLKPFSGILDLLDDTDDDIDTEDLKLSDSIEDDEFIIMDESDDRNSSIITEPVVCGALSSLICNYESSDEEPTIKTTQLHHNQSEISKVVNNVMNQNATVKPNELLKSNSNILNDVEECDNDSGPEEAKIVKAINAENNIDVPIRNSAEPSNKGERREKQEKSKINNIKNGPKQFKSKLPSTLLEKLLRNEIRQERNIVLQCIRYIIKNNYFDKS